MMFRGTDPVVFRITDSRVVDFVHVASGIRNAILFYSGLFDHVVIVWGSAPSLSGSGVRDRRGAE